MKNLLRLLTLFIALATSTFAAPESWAERIDAMTAADAEKPPVQGAVVFVGSSSIALWKNVVADFPDFPVINRGFGGSEVADSVYYIDRIVLPYRPRAVVFYAGENDLVAGKNPETVAADFAAFREKLHTALPETKLYYVSIKFSQSRDKFRPEMIRTNELIAADCATHKGCAYVDLNALMLDAEGNPRPELFLDDKLHMNAAGYAIWTKHLTPLLRP